jgi:uncharacterized membrane protein YhaH (DUF805 family)
VRSRTLAWWIFLSLNTAVPLLALLSVVVAGWFTGDLCTGGEPLVASLVGITVVLLPAALVLDVAVSLVRRHDRRWRRGGAIGGLVCIVSLVPLLLAVLLVTPMCW